MLALTSTSLIGYSSIILVWGLIFWLVLTERIGWANPTDQTTWIYCPVCDNELVADEATICVDQWRWTEHGIDPDDLVSDWHNRLGPFDTGLAEYMGLTNEQYSLWVEYPPTDNFEIVYKCGKCKSTSAWDFDHYPIPVLNRYRAFNESEESTE